MRVVTDATNDQEPLNLRGPQTTYAEKDQQRIPRPPSHQEHDRKVEKGESFAHLDCSRSRDDT